jgi:hypothetical protein
MSAALLLFAWLLTASPDAGTPVEAPSFQWEPPPEVISEPSIPDALPVQARALVVKAEGGNPAEHYLRSFLEQGLQVETHQVTASEGLPAVVTLITGYDPVAMISYRVIVQRSADRLYTVFLGEVDLRANNETRPTDFAPIHPLGMRAVRGEGEGLRTILYKVQLPEEEVLAFYEGHLIADGFRKGDDEGVYLKGTEELTLSVSRKGAQVSVSLSLRDAEPGELPTVSLK